MNILSNFDFMFTIIPIFAMLVFVATFIIIIYCIIHSSKVFKGVQKLTEDPLDTMEKIAQINAKAKATYEKEVNPELKALKCPNCGAGATTKDETCPYCGSALTVVASKK